MSGNKHKSNASHETSSPITAVKSHLRLHHSGQKKTFKVTKDVDAIRLADSIREYVARDVGNNELVVDFRGLDRWPRGHRRLILRTLKPILGQCLFTVRPEQTASTKLFEAVLDLIERSNDLERTARVKEIVVEAAQICHPDVVNEALQVASERYIKLDLTGGRLSELKRIAKASRLIDTKRDEADPTRLARRFLISLEGEDGWQADDNYRLTYYNEEFYAWNNGAWLRKSSSELEAELAQRLQRIGPGEFAITSGFVKNVLTNVAALVKVFPWNVEPPILLEDSKAKRSSWLVFENGMVDLTTEAVEADDLGRFEHSRWHFTEVKLPFSYDPKASCELWLQTLQEIFPERDMGDRRIKVLQEFMGFSLAHWDLNLEKFLILHGCGENGKSTILRLWIDLLGDVNLLHMSLRHLAERFNQAELRGKLANVCFDMGHVTIEEAGTLKSLVSCEPVTAERKYLSAIRFTNRAKFIFSTNELPTIRDNTKGFWRRVLLIPFFEEFGDRRDTDRAKRLKTELPGIFNWALEGARRLLKRKRFTDCTVCYQALAEYRGQFDSVAAFISYECVTGPDRTVTNADLWSSYKTWSKQRNLLAVQEKEFSQRVRELTQATVSRPGSHREVKRRRIWRGIGFRG